MAHDQAAAARDRTAELREAWLVESAEDADARLRALAEHAAALRAQAASDRMRAAADRPGRVGSQGRGGGSQAGADRWPATSSRRLIAARNLQQAEADR